MSPSFLQWYYPYYYAPFASDLKGLAGLEISFSRGKPFKPFDQLLGVLPAASSMALPPRFRRLMTDRKSPLVNFYTNDFEIDMNGKRHAWQGVVKLPFIDEKKLLAETKKLEDSLTKEEKFRNTVKVDLLYFHESHPLWAKIENCPELVREATWRIDATASDGMSGFLKLTKRKNWDKTIPSPINGLEDIKAPKVKHFLYLNPDPHAHISKLPDGVIIPKKILSAVDIKPSPIRWHNDRKRGEVANHLGRNTFKGRRNYQVNYASNRFRPTAPFGGYERGFSGGTTNQHRARASGYDQGSGQYGSRAPPDRTRQSAMHSRQQQQTPVAAGQTKTIYQISYLRCGCLRPFTRLLRR